MNKKLLLLVLLVFPSFGLTFKSSIEILIERCDAWHATSCEKVMEYANRIIKEKHEALSNAIEKRDPVSVSALENVNDLTWKLNQPNQ